MQHSFQLTDQPIDGTSLQARLENDQAGAWVVFEGRVRNHNEGKKVTHLFYEAAPDLVNQAFADIAAEVAEQFDILAVHAVHRVGSLAIGDCAVWIGVCAAHRGDAFDACRTTIDELKKRVPIWKKEHYTDGDSGWIDHP